MVIDRSSSVLLLAYLMHHGKDTALTFPPAHIISFVNDHQHVVTLFQVNLILTHGLLAAILGGLIALDISSHYMHMVAAISNGASSHKKISTLNVSSNFGEWLLSWYYESQVVLFLVCAFNEVFFLCIFAYTIPITKVSLFLTQISNYFATSLTLLDDFYAIYLPNLLKASFPVALLKQVINVVQLKRAVSKLVQAETNSISSGSKYNKKYE